MLYITDPMALLHIVRKVRFRSVLHFLNVEIYRYFRMSIYLMTPRKFICKLQAGRCQLHLL